MTGRTTGRLDVLDCSRPAVFLLWFVMGTVLGFIIMSVAQGDWPSLLHVGSRNPLLHQIEADLGPLSPVDARGHDGQFYYLIARDPFGRGQTPGAIAAFDDNGPHYRYRRILYPLLAGGLGQFGGRSTLKGMMVSLAIAMGLAMVAIADLSYQLGLGGGTVLAATLNAGALVSLWLLTADALALALALGGMSIALRSKTAWAIAAFALAALTKEVYLLVPWAMAAWLWTERRHRTAIAMAILPVLPILAWTSWVVTSLPSGTVQKAIFDLPFAGIVDGISVWIREERNFFELFLAAIVAASFVTAGVMLAVGRSSVLRFLVAPWLALGLVSNLEIWGKPNNTVRAFAILWPLSILLASHWRSDQGTWRRTTGR